MSTLIITRHFRHYADAMMQHFRWCHWLCIDGDYEAIFSHFHCTPFSTLTISLHADMPFHVADWCTLFIEILKHYVRCIIFAWCSHFRRCMWWNITRWCAKYLRRWCWWHYYFRRHHSSLHTIFDVQLCVFYDESFHHWHFDICTLFHWCSHELFSPAVKTLFLRYFLHRRGVWP